MTRAGRFTSATVFSSLLLFILVMTGCESKSQDSTAQSNPETISRPIQDAGSDTVPLSIPHVKPSSDPVYLKSAMWATVPKGPILTDQNTSTFKEFMAETDQGLQLTGIHDIGDMMFRLNVDLTDEFEMLLRLRLASDADLQKAGFVQGNNLVGMIGLSIGSNSLEASLKPADITPTVDVRIRASQGVASLSGTGFQPIYRKRTNSDPGFFYLKLNSHHQVIVEGLEVRTGIAPDPTIVADFERVNGSSQTSSEPRPKMPPSMIGPGTGVGPAMGMPQVDLPIPTKSGALFTTDSWFVPKSTNANRDKLVRTSVQIVAENGSVRITKTGGPEEVWVLRQLSEKKDFQCSFRVSIPDLQKQRSRLTPMSLLGVGVFPVSANTPGLTSVAPSPTPSDAAEFDVSVMRIGDKVTLSIDGSPVKGDLISKEALVVGLYFRSGLQATVSNFKIGEPSSSSTPKGT